MKYLKKKIIGGNPYYYLEYKLGKEHKTVSEYLGREIPSDILARLHGFFEKVALIHIKRLEQEKGRFPTYGIDAVEHARFEYIRLNYEFFQADLRLFQNLFCTLFTLNSNRSEGSKATLADIEQVLSKRSAPKTVIEKEINNSLTAFDFAFSKKMKWNAKTIKKIHELLLWNIHPEIAGKYKKIDNTIGNQPTTTWKNVKREMQTLLNWLREQKKRGYVPEVAVEFHWKFEVIHPFEDGNGRVGRILLNAFLVQSGYSPVIFFSENHERYCNAIAKAREGHTRALFDHFIESVKKTKKMIEYYKKEGSITGGSPKMGTWEINQGKIRRT